ncbi:hypothetical protein [Actinorugispora endophytica]|uniref:Uncharacterized protein n=1 Tax=Actinorugispora endophytica TaxID=1605990 RepID=A0A4R6UGU9_9ACTN|nr:hypothetical protein [Actinorugispora endophytica]TDQ44175.1 hypothetical protein EV190_13712 [Actinorugispora endophytica]
MSPKKKNPRGPRPRQRDGAGTPATAGTAKRVPLVVEDPRPRWPLLLWGLLTILWVLGSLASFMMVLASAGVMPEDVTDATRREGAWALVWLLLFALAVPLAGAAGAALLRRRVAAVMFVFALLLSAAGLWTVASPTALWEALSGGFSSR